MAASIPTTARRKPLGPGPRPLLTAALALLLAACSGGGEFVMPPAEVSAAPVLVRSVAQWDEFTGRIEAIEQAEIRPQVAGTITAVHFREGALLRRGQLLFEIDDRPYRAALDVARADLARAEARQRLARSELARSRSLLAENAVSAGEVEARENEAGQAEADTLAARARVAQAELELSFTRISAPIDGRAGAILLRTGNLVGVGEPVLTRVVSKDPVHVSFRSDERAYLRYQAMAREGERPSSRDAANPVRVALANEQGFPHEGRMVFVDNIVDPATGTILARAELANPDGRFTPGLFARVRLLGSGEREAVLIHPQAVLTDQDRRYVFVLGEGPEGGNVALRRDVVLGPQIDGLVVVEQGLAAGDRVVVNGMRRIFFPGAPVLAREVAMDAPDAASGSDSRRPDEG
ncbi:efflux RND transporter periplasmic adaptor subunit [Silanimonas sp.]|uniref:efflux RND transporter periplasmic adaptor subunit n=1 Tax=Silanimonas sp. TaxID=1929290 RepID=UPI001BC4C5FC|nr:efflux RND transporter periplasmic adaptor subunit [Silanimonas sp.]MBS3896776.1 efflux RND transporter periplasmic adaptor subunit [Silanimonas sp.]MBS3924138.1 efflux RND transporter periplasmic adaptor subunit [Xanthomonadaceae bacterium]